MSKISAIDGCVSDKINVLGFSSNMVYIKYVDNDNFLW